MNEILQKDLFSKLKAKSLELRKTTHTERLQNLKKLESLIEKNQKNIVQALAQDFGKPEAETLLSEVYPVLQEIEFIKKNLKSWMSGQVVPTSVAMGFGDSWIQYQPKGLSLVISPWNYPFYLAVMPVISALVAGCNVVLKPSEITPHTSQLLKNIFSQFNQDLVFVIEGGVETTTQLLKLPWDHVFFTGSTAVGKIIMKACAENLTPVTLELGGKSPTIIDETANLKIAAEKVVWGKFLNAGQTCVAPDYLLVQKEIKGKFVHEVLTALKSMYAQNQSEHLAQIVNEKNFVRLDKVLKTSQQQGCQLHAPSTSDSQNRKIDPTILDISTELSPQNFQQINQIEVMKEEIFGPLLPIIAYQNLSDAISYINSHDKPLALYIFSNKKAHIDQILNETSSGGVCINDTVIHLASHHLPFGGIHHSGHGSYHGIYGFKCFSHERAVYKQSFLGRFMKFIYPPFTPAKLSILKLLIKMRF